MDSGLLLLNLGYGLMFIALAIHEILWLRCTLTFAQVTLFIYNIFVSNNYNIAFWMCLFVIVNTIQIVRIINERRPRFIPEELIDLYDGIFSELTSKEFLYFWNMGTLKEVTDEYFIRSGQTQENLLLVLDGIACVEFDGKKIVILDRGSFIAEISFLTGEPASADVRADGQLFYISWGNERLKRVQIENPGFWIKLQNCLSKDLIDKVKPKNKKETQVEE